MSKIKTPKKPKDITTEWMNHALSKGGFCKPGAISGIDVRPLGPHVKGLLSLMCRVNLIYEKEEPGLLKSVVIKFPSEIEQRKNLGNHFGAYEREVRFYRELAERSPIRIPKCYYNVLDRENDDYILVLEDAGSWTPGDQINGLTVNQTKSAVKAIAGFHGYWWGSPELERLTWMPYENRGSLHEFHDNWDDFKDEHSDILSGEDIAAGNLIAESGQKIHDLCLISPRTIIHYDFRADNMMFDKHDEVMVLDWQIAIRSFGAFDVVRAVCGSHHGVLEKNHHREFLNLWYEGLLAMEVKNYSIEEAWRDYRVGIINSSYVPVVAHHFLSHEGSRGSSILKAMIERIFYAFHECDVLELLN